MKSRFLSGKKFFYALTFVLIVHCTLYIENCEGQWIPYPLPYYGVVYTIGFYDLNNGISFGHDLNPVHLYSFRTTNCGISWNPVSYPQELRSILDFQYINSSTAYACGAENFILESNFNLNNQFLSYPNTIRTKLLLEGKRELYLIYKGAFIKTTNGGAVWQRASTFDTLTGYINDIHFFNANSGYALMDSNSYGNTKFYKTTNGGAVWQFVKLIQPNTHLDEMIFFDMNTGIAKGFRNGGYIFKTTNAGLNWVSTSMATQIDGITFFNSTTGIAIGILETGIGNYIYKTTNAGNNWILSNTISGTVLYSNLKSLPNTGTAFAVGDTIETIWSGKITTLKTTNYGLNWVMKQFNPKLMPYGLALVDANNFFMGIGDMYAQAQILKSTNGGNVFVNQINSEIPSSYSLSQNYPNPFNPMTKIKFDILTPHLNKGGQGGVSLKIYDILGKEIATLVNENLQPGTYVVDFDGTNFPNGIYFYRLITEDFSETRKMLLLK